MKKKSLLIMLALSTLIWCNSYAVAASMGDYCQVPAFMSSAVPPNIFFTVDVSGSMAWEAYSYGDTDSNNDGILDHYQRDGNGNPNGAVYEGYFTPDKYYQLDVNNIYTELAGSPACNITTTWQCYNTNTKPYNGCVWKQHGCNKYACPQTQYAGVCPQNSGNYLNYSEMERIDLVRWAMTGGTPASCDPSTSHTFNSSSCEPELYNTVTGTNAVSSVCSDTLSINTDGSLQGGCILLADNGTKVKVSWDRVYGGLVFNLKDLPIKPRLGALLFHNTGVDSQGQVYVGDFTASNNTSVTFPYMNLITALNSSYINTNNSSLSIPGGSTPTGPGMQDTMNYFAQTSAQYGGFTPQSGNSGVWKNPLYNCVCDTTNPAYPNCTGGQSSCYFVPCAKNFVMLLSDGQWNQPSCGFNSDPVKQAYNMHEGFTNLPTNYQTNISAVYTLGLFLNGPGDLAMKNIAMYGSFDTAHGTWPDSTGGFPTAGPCLAQDCGGSSANGSSCTNLPASSPDWDKNGDNLPDTYYSAQDALGIKNAIYNAILDALRRVSSGTAVSILSSSQGSGADLIQAVFYPSKVYDLNTSKDLTWTSEMQNLWYYIDPYLQTSSIREDSIQDSILNLTNDRIAQFYYDTTSQKTRVRLWDDSGDGTPNLASQTIVDFEDLKNLWSAGKLLWSRDADGSTRHIYTTITGSSRMDFLSGNSGTLYPYLQAANSAEGANIISYIRGTDSSSYRDRTYGSNTWKLGDIINSTPRIAAGAPLNGYAISSPRGYGDQTYSLFSGSQDYVNRGMVYVGANDGMLHAFYLGNLEQHWTGQGTAEKARLSGANRGTEAWGYIPKNALPYLTYLTDPDYCHLFYIDQSPTLADVSINTPTYQASNAAGNVFCQPSARPSCGSGTYSDCPKQTCINTSSKYMISSSWKTVLIGGMRLGGSCKNPNDSCSSATACVKAPMWDPGNASNALGLSSYFALDVTNQDDPRPLWEFSSPDLGFSTSGPAIVRVGNKDNNGKWFAVFASGSTGPISSMQFQGTSNQNLKVFVVDLLSGTLLRTIDTGLSNAFAGSLKEAASDPDRWNNTATGFYQDDALYFGYTQKDLNTGTWTKGGILRLLTKESANPGDWTISTLIDNIGPVTAAVGKLQDRTTPGHGALWLFFGTGRYFYKTAGVVDDADGLRAIYGIKEPCYDSFLNKLNSGCASSVSAGSLVNQTTTVGSVDYNATGWYVNLEGTSATTNYKAERIITDPIASPNGAVFFASYEPSSNVCALEGNSFLWGVQYNTGGFLASSMLKGEILVQMSTGSIEEKKLADIFASSRRGPAMAGMTSSSGSLSAPHTPVKKFLHIRER